MIHFANKNQIGNFASLDIINSNTVKRKNINYYINMFLKDYFSLLTF